MKNLHYSPLVDDLFFTMKGEKIENKVTLGENFIQLPLIQDLLALLNYQFKNPLYLLQSLTHSSFSHEFLRFPLPHNERFEFVGDALLDTLISLKLFQMFPDKGEGHLSKLRGSLVNEASLGQLATFMHLGECLLLGKGLRKKWEQEKIPSILADTFEALLAAIYFDGGLKETEGCFWHIVSRWEKETGQSYISEEKGLTFDVKSLLQELTMEKFQQLPEYKIIDEKIDPDNREKKKIFLVTLTVGEELVAQTWSESKKKAEKELAAIGLKYFKEQLC